MTSERPLQRPGVQLCLLGLLCLAVKAGLVLSLADVFFYGEELEKGTAAKAMLDGLAVPHHQLAYHYYEGGGFVVSHLKALAFLLVGENLLAHKLVAMGFVLAVLGLGWCFTRSLFGQRAALWFGLLFVFAPLSFQKLTLINLGIHFEACAFLFAVLALGARLAFTDEGRRRDWVVLGLVTGFGLYFSYQVALVAAWVALVLVVRRPRAVLGLEGALGFAGTVVGALPLVWMYSLVGEAIFDIHGESLGLGEVGRTAKVAAFLRSLFLEAPALSRMMAHAWTVALVLALGGLTLWRGVRPSERGGALYILGYLASFGGVYLSSSFVQGELTHFFLLLRLAPVWCLGTVLIAAGLASLAERQETGLRRMGAMAMGVLLLLGISSTMAALQAGSPDRLASNLEVLRVTKGYSYDQYLAKVLWHFDGDRLAKLELVEGFEEEERSWVRAAAVADLFRTPGVPAEAELPRALAELGALPEARFEQYAFGLGQQLLISSRWDTSAALALLEANPSALTPILMESLGRTGGGRHPLAAHFERELERALELEDPRAYLRGLGRWVYGRFRLSEERARRFWSTCDTETAAQLLEGYRRERRWHTLGSG